jgi:hypothetical protein
MQTHCSQVVWINQVILIVYSNHSILMHFKAILTSLKHQSMDNYIGMYLI